MQFALPDLQAPAPEHDPLAGAKLVAGQIERLIVEAARNLETLKIALLGGNHFNINAAALQLAVSGQSIHVLGRMVQRDLSAYSRREPKIRSRT